ncbi:MAG: acyl-CoA dehydrogenase, partial [Rhodobiaceae bacterium]|nr:acyl-CoA dehydrogenase [Rhodobiaceae bacterium]
MSLAEDTRHTGKATPELIQSAAESARELVARARDAVRARTETDGKLDSAKLEAEQRATHGLAWYATYANALTQLGDYAARMREEGRFGEAEELVTGIAAAEYAAQ